MKKLFLALFVLIIVLSLAFTTKRYSTTLSTKDIFDQFISNTEKLIDQSKELKENSSKWSDIKIIDHYIKMRKTFKTVEPLLTYYAEDDYNKYFNGAPLPKLEPNVPEISVLEPKGFQVLDEEVFGFLNRENIKYLSGEIEKDLSKSIKILKSLNLDKRMVLEASRSEILRVVSLSLSGFDTPGSANFIDDTQTVFTTLNQYLSLFSDDFSKDEKEIFDRIDSLLEKLDEIDEPTSLDYVDIIRNDIDPIYGLLLDFHLRSGIPHIKEVTNRVTPLNYYAKSIFADDFLNLPPFSHISSRDTTLAKRKLGKLLFYDTILSKEDNQSCATCHDPKKAFTDGQKVRRSVNGHGRNTPTLINSIHNRVLFYDMRASKPDLQVDHVVYNPEEFNTNYNEIRNKLKANETYNGLFKKAYGNIGLNRYSVTDAILQYVSSLTSYNSAFDKYMRRETEEYNKDAYAGFNLFMGKGTCASCHFVPVFNGTVPPSYEDTESEILGVIANNDFENPILDNDPGRIANGDVRQESEIYHRSFKTSTVRNIALTAPYMHNGVHNTLEEVIKFYNVGGGQGMDLDVPYQTLPPDSLGLTQKEIGQLVTFMNTLTDTIGMTRVSVLPKR